MTLESIIKLGGLWLDRTGQVKATKKNLRALDKTRLEQVRSRRDEIKGYLSAAIDRDRTELRELVSRVNDLWHRLNRHNPEGDHQAIIDRDWPRAEEAGSESEVL